MIPYDKFQNSPYSIYDRRWTTYPSWMLSWVLRQLGVWDSAQSDGKLPELRYAVIANLEEAADQILKTSFSSVNTIDRILSRDMFRQIAADALDISGQLSPKDTDLLLTFLHRDKKAITYDSHVSSLVQMEIALLTPSRPLSSPPQRNPSQHLSQIKIVLSHPLRPSSNLSPYRFRP